MALNERVEYLIGDIKHEQLAPSQAARTEFTPGKATSRPGDENWPTDFRIPTGTPAFDGEAAGSVKMERSRVTKLHRNIMDDQVIAAPAVIGTKTTVIDNDSVWGATDPEHTLTETETQPVNYAGHQRDNENPERNTGYDNIKSA